MKIIRYEKKTGDLPEFASLDHEGRAWRIEGNPWQVEPVVTKEEVFPERLLAPLIPSAIIGIALNYRPHAGEMEVPIPTRPVFFIKLPGSLQNPHEPIVIPGAAASTKVDYEAELAVILGKDAKNVPEHEAMDYVLGYTCANDVTARDWQKEWGGGQYCRGKGFDTFCPLGPCLVTADEIPNPQGLCVRSYVNGEVRQEGQVSDLIFGIPQLIAFLSQSTTLEAGTVILTGTPAGVGIGFDPPRYLREGDTVTIEIPGIGSLINPVAVEKFES
jgi:2-keto-4-pentenoate hydratase/2-oxohepta-3-ene-1,7-dioic acid hydratase in catechol pathway